MDNDGKLFIGVCGTENARDAGSLFMVLPGRVNGGTVGAVVRGLMSGVGLMGFNIGDDATPLRFGTNLGSC